jgi:hypothetical protein
VLMGEADHERAEKLELGYQRTRRDIMKMGAILRAMAVTRSEGAIASADVCAAGSRCSCLLRDT